MLTAWDTELYCQSNLTDPIQLALAAGLLCGKGLKCSRQLWPARYCPLLYLHANDGIDEEEHGNQQGYIGKGLEREQRGKDENIHVM